MEVVLYPDPRLRRRNAPVQRFDADLEALVRDMFEAMYRTKGVGLAAPQAGLNLRLLVYNPEGDPAKSQGERVLCNPKIVWRSRDKDWGEEGCLSFPGIFARIERPTAVHIEAQDLHGQPTRLELADWDGRIFQHELDHLEGILFIDRMTPSDKVRIKPLLDELAEKFSTARAQA